MSSTTSEADIHPAVRAIVRRNEGRKPELVRLKYERMGEDVFAFFRGTDHLFAWDWPDLKPVDPGPSIVICGDLHLENFGCYRADDGEFQFDLNDFDEAIIGPCSIDLVRCATSVLLAAQVWGLTPIQAFRTVLGYLDSYRDAVAGSVDWLAGAPEKMGPIEALLDECKLATQADLLARFTRLDRSGARTIRRSSGRFPAVGKAKAAAIAGAVEEHGRVVGRPDAFRVLDVAGRIAGIGSLGVRRYVALVEGDGSPDGNRLLDIKQARPSSLADLAERPMPPAWADDARRVVEAQRQIQARATAGLDVLEVGGANYRLREMIPDENRARLDRFRRKPSRLRQAVEAAGRVTARAQLRGARLDGHDRTEELVRWAASPALDAVLAPAARFAEKARDDFKAFRKARLDLQT